MIPGSGPESVRYDSGSFRDPNSRVWRDGNRVLRGLNEAAATDFAALTATKFLSRSLQGRRLDQQRGGRNGGTQRV